MTKKNASRSTSNGDEFFRMLEGAKLYLMLHKGDLKREEMTEYQMQTVIDYARYLERMNQLTIKQLGEEL